MPRRKDITNKRLKAMKKGYNRKLGKAAEEEVEVDVEVSSERSFRVFCNEEEVPSENLSVLSRHLEEPIDQVRFEEPIDEVHMELGSDNNEMLEQDVADEYMEMKLEELHKGTNGTTEQQQFQCNEGVVDPRNGDGLVLEVDGQTEEVYLAEFNGDYRDCKYI